MGVSARPLDESHVRLQWREIAEADEYRIYRGSDDNLLYYATSAGSPFIDAHVQSGQEYLYAIISARSDGSLVSRLSQTVRARPGARPWVTGAKMETETSVRVYFSEPMNERIKEATNYSIDGQVGRPVSVAHDASGEEAVLMLLRPFPQSGQYRVTCRDLADLDDTPLDTLRNSADFMVTFAPKNPYLVEGRLIAANRIELVFSEDMDSSVEDSDNYDLGENMDVVSAIRSAGVYDRVQLTIESKSPIGALGLSYPIRVKNLKSAAGVAMRPGRGTFIELIFVRENLQDVFTYPNPCLAGLGDRKVTFANLTREAEIRILTSYGLPVRTLFEDNGDGGVDWDLRNESGQIVASGIYIYRVTCKNQSVTGKLAVIR